jgi:hypothetical protein
MTRGCRSAGLLGLLCIVACGRLGFDTTEHALEPRIGDARHSDAGARDASLPDGPHDAGAPDAGMDSGQELILVPGPDAALDAALEPDAASDAAEPRPIDPACSSAYPTRLWPSASDVASCVDSFGLEHSTTGPGAADYTIYEGCSSWLEFDVSPGIELRVRTFGDGCVCTACSLYHLHYQLQEDLGSGYAPQIEVEEPDDIACPNGSELENYTSYTPLTTRVRMQVLNGTTGAGFYFVVCGG